MRTCVIEYGRVMWSALLAVVCALDVRAQDDPVELSAPLQVDQISAMLESIDLSNDQYLAACRILLPGYLSYQARWFDIASHGSSIAPRVDGEQGQVHLADREKWARYLAGVGREAMQLESDWLAGLDPILTAEQSSLLSLLRTERRNAVALNACAAMGAYPESLSLAWWLYAGGSVRRSETPVDATALLETSVAHQRQVIEAIQKECIDLYAPWHTQPMGAERPDPVLVERGKRVVRLMAQLRQAQVDAVVEVSRLLEPLDALRLLGDFIAVFAVRYHRLLRGFPMVDLLSHEELRRRIATADTETREAINERISRYREVQVQIAQRSLVVYEPWLSFIAGDESPRFELEREQQHVKSWKTQLREIEDQIGRVVARLGRDDQPPEVGSRTTVFYQVAPTYIDGRLTMAPERIRAPVGDGLGAEIRTAIGECFSMSVDERSVLKALLNLDDSELNAIETRFGHEATALGERCDEAVVAVINGRANSTQVAGREQLAAGLRDLESVLLDLRARVSEAILTGILLPPDGRDIVGIDRLVGATAEYDAATALTIAAGIEYEGLASVMCGVDLCRFLAQSSVELGNEPRLPSQITSIAVAHQRAARAHCVRAVVAADDQAMEAADRECAAAVIDLWGAVVRVAQSLRRNGLRPEAVTDLLAPGLSAEFGRLQATVTACMLDETQGSERGSFVYDIVLASVEEWANRLIDWEVTPEGENLQLRAENLAAWQQHRDAMRCQIELAIVMIKEGARRR